MERKLQPNLNTQIYEEACDWFVEFRGGDVDADARRTFDLWARKSPEHLAAYLEIAAIWNEGPSLDPKAKWSADMLIAEAALDRENVVALPRQSIGESARAIAGSVSVEEVRHRKLRRFLAAASFAVVALVAGSFIWLHYFQASTYATATGEQRSIALVDGSVIELNSRSKVEVRFSKTQRDVNLVSGQALFHVAKDPARPFIVASEGTRVRAVGTQFDVYKKHGGTIVTVVEGTVVVVRSGVEPSNPLEGSGTPNVPVQSNADPGASLIANAVYLSAGEQLTVTPKTERKTAHPNVASATAWTQRELVFDSASLSEVAEEFNRYNDRQLVIDDSALYDFHISGVFSSTDPASLIRFLRQRPGVEVTETASEIRIAKK